MAFQVIADLDLCQGHQMCQAEALEVFDYDDETDKVVVLQEFPDESQRSDVESAVTYCPALALAIRDIP